MTVPKPSLGRTCLRSDGVAVEQQSVEGGAAGQYFGWDLLDSVVIQCQHLQALQAANRNRQLLPGRRTNSTRLYSTPLRPQQQDPPPPPSERRGRTL